MSAGQIADSSSLGAIKVVVVCAALKIARSMSIRLLLLLALCCGPSAMRGETHSPVINSFSDPVLVSPPGLATPPRLLTRGPIKYPGYLINRFVYLRGDVVFDLLIDPLGQVAEAKLISTTHPAFLAPALASIVTSTFSPAWDGRPTVGHITVMSSFDVQNWRTKNSMGVPPDTYPRKPKGLPPEYDYDVAPVLTSFFWPVYPRELLVSKTAGSAAVRYTINAEGVVIATEVLSASKPEFGGALAAALETWHFTPAIRGKFQVATQLVQTEQFSSWAHMRPKEETRIVRALRKGRAFPAPSALDRPLWPVFRPAPRYPANLDRERVTGSAVIEFIVSKQGEAMLPRIVHATRAEFGWAAATAVSYWYFRPPQLKGKPTDVVTQVEIDFRPPPTGKG